jgi:hypothetical protein
MTELGPGSEDVDDFLSPETPEAELGATAIAREGKNSDPETQSGSAVTAVTAEEKATAALSSLNWKNELETMIDDIESDAVLINLKLHDYIRMFDAAQFVVALLSITITVITAIHGELISYNSGYAGNDTSTDAPTPADTHLAFSMNIAVLACSTTIAFLVSFIKARRWREKMDVLSTNLNTINLHISALKKILETASKISKSHVEDRDYLFNEKTDIISNYVSACEQIDEVLGMKARSYYREQQKKFGKEATATRTKKRNERVKKLRKAEKAETEK